MRHYLTAPPSENFAQTLSAVMSKGKAKQATVTLAHLAIDDDDLAYLLEDIGKHTTLACYVYGATIAAPKNPALLKKVTVNIGIRLSPLPKQRQRLAAGQAIGEGANLARHLGNLPANVCTPAVPVKTSTAAG